MKKETLTTESAENTEAVQLSGNSGSFKERPILFNGEMVRAILDGRKTQTRRPVKNDTVLDCLNKNCRHEDKLTCELTVGDHSPFGNVEDLLWVRETWRQFNSSEECACYDHCVCARYSGKFLYRASSDCDEAKWKPSIHMPRKACRIKLRVKRVWIERVQNITESDAEAEGVSYKKAMEYADEGSPDFKLGFFDLWDSIYKPNRRDGTPPWQHPYEWLAFPWVWACEFELAEVKR